MEIHENTLLWYSSDNGGLNTETSGGREKKGSLYEEELSVPAMLEWPEHIRDSRYGNALRNFRYLSYACRNRRCSRPKPIPSRWG